MSFENISSEYLNALHEYIDSVIPTGETTPELSYRPILDSFLRAVAQIYSSEVDIIFEPRSQGNSGRPDWRIYNNSNLGLYGYVEAKGFDPINPINIERHKDQINKYLKTGQSVILTDGIEFVFFDQSSPSPPQRYFLFDKPVRIDTNSDPRINFLLDNRFREFFRDSGFRQCSEEQLIREIAIRASAISESVLILSQAPIGSGVSNTENRTIELLHDLQSILRLHHDPVLKHAKVFADFVAQILCFGLLYAHRIVAGDSDTPQTQYNAISRFWSDTVYDSFANRLVPFKSLVAILESELSEEESESQLRCWYDDALRLLAHVQLRDTQRTSPDYHTLYERFLIEFDPKTRFDFGAFYTPRELANFTVGVSNAIISSSFSGCTLFDDGNKIIDPCCGTGTFLEELIKQSVEGNSVHLIGFEILPAPYALAHYRIDMINSESTPGQRIEVFLTNTLSDDMNEGQDNHSDHVLYNEICRARDRARPPIVLVIGNPPSSDSFGPHSTGDNFTKIDFLLEDFRPAGVERRSRQNTQKQIGNDFMKFLRWASDKVLATDRGALAMIIPSSFASHPTYQPARKWLVNNFKHFWIMDIDRDLRTGVRSSSLFDTQQGRLLFIATHTGDVPNEGTARLHYKMIADKTRMQKKLFLDLQRTTSEYLSLFTQYNLNIEDSVFRPERSGYDKELYSKFWAIHSKNSRGPEPDERCIFARHCSGVKLAPTALFVHTDKAILQRRSIEVGNTSVTYAQIKMRWFSGQRKPPPEIKLTVDVRQQLKTAATNESQYHTYAFRPFVSMYLLFDNTLLQLLSSLGGGGTRLRPEVISAYSSSETIGISIAPSPIDIGSDIHRFATFSWDIPDNDLCARGNAHVFCNQFPENKPSRSSEWDPTPKENISKNLLVTLRRSRPETTPRDVVFYTYAVLSSGILLEAFADAYFKASATENIPRIPIVKDPDKMSELIVKGQKLAELEKPSEEYQIQDWIQRFEGEYRYEFNLMKFFIDYDNEKIQLYSEDKNIEITLDNIPQCLLKLTISGYEVVSCWLKFHSYAYTRTAFSQTEFDDLLKLLSNLDLQTGIIHEIDLILEGVISREVELL